MGSIGACGPCAVKVEERNKKFICQYCGVPIKGDWANTPVKPSFHHLPNCPRSDSNEIVIEIPDVVE